MRRIQILFEEVRVESGTGGLNTLQFFLGHGIFRLVPDDDFFGELDHQPLIEMGCWTHFC